MARFEFDFTGIADADEPQAPAPTSMFDERTTRFEQRMAELGYPVVRTSDRRSSDEQGRLYAQGRTTSGPIVTNARPGQSTHERGEGRDYAFLVNGKPSWEESLPWDVLGRVAQEEGLEWGGTFKSISDRPHVQMPQQAAAEPAQFDFSGISDAPQQPTSTVEPSGFDFSGIAEAPPPRDPRAPRIEAVKPPKPREGAIGWAIDAASGLKDYVGSLFTSVPVSESASLPALSREGEKLVPFAGSITQMARAAEVLDAARRLRDGNGSLADERVVMEHVGDDQRPTEGGRAFGYQVGEVASMILPFAAEFALTGGAYAVGRRISQKAIEKLLGEAAEKVLANRASRLATRTVATAAGVAAQTTANVPRIAEGTITRQVEAVLNNEDDGFVPAFARAFPDTFVEIGSERSGALLTGPMKKLAESTLGKKAAALKTAVMERWLKLQPNRTVTEFLDRVRSETGWHGILGEMFEERVGAVSRMALPEPLQDPSAMQSPEARLITGAQPAGQSPVADPRAQALKDLGYQLAVEATAFAVPGGTRLALETAAGRRQPRDEKKPAAPAVTVEAPKPTERTAQKPTEPAPDVLGEQPIRPQAVVPATTGPATEVQPTPAPTRPTAPPSAAGVPFMVTTRMVADLKARGLDDAQIRLLTPQEAYQILSMRPERAAEPPSAGPPAAAQPEQPSVATAAAPKAGTVAPETGTTATWRAEQLQAGFEEADVDRAMTEARARGVDPTQAQDLRFLEEHLATLRNLSPDEAKSIEPGYVPAKPDEPSLVPESRPRPITSEDERAYETKARKLAEATEQARREYLSVLDARIETAKARGVEDLEAVRERDRVASGADLKTLPAKPDRPATVMPIRPKATEAVAPKESSTALVPQPDAPAETFEPGKMAVQIEGNRNVREVSSFEEVGRIVDEIRDRLEQSGAGGASQFPRIDVIDVATGNVVAHSSYNGRIWKGPHEAWTSSTKEIARADDRGYGKPPTVSGRVEDHIEEPPKPSGTMPRPFKTDLNSLIERLETSESQEEHDAAMEELERVHGITDLNVIEALAATRQRRRPATSGTKAPKSLTLPASESTAVEEVTETGETITPAVRDRQALVTAKVPNHFEDLPANERREVRRVVDELHNFGFQKAASGEELETGGALGGRLSSEYEDERQQREGNLRKVTPNAPVYHAINRTRNSKVSGRRIVQEGQKYIAGGKVTAIVHDIVRAARERVYGDPIAGQTRAMLPPSAGMVEGEIYVRPQRMGQPDFAKERGVMHRAQSKPQTFLNRYRRLHGRNFSVDRMMDVLGGGEHTRSSAEALIQYAFEQELKQPLAENEFAVFMRVGPAVTPAPAGQIELALSLEAPHPEGRRSSSLAEFNIYAALQMNRGVVLEYQAPAQPDDAAIYEISRLINEFQNNAEFLYSIFDAQGEPRDVAWLQAYTQESAEDGQETDIPSDRLDAARPADPSTEAEPPSESGAAEGPARPRDQGQAERPDDAVDAGVRDVGAPPLHRREYLNRTDYNASLQATYPEGVSSRATPQTAEIPPVGSWMIEDKHEQLDGHDIEQLVEVDVDQLEISEDTGRARFEDVERYARWTLEGREAPPITVVQTDRGTLKTLDHRRLLAAKAAGAQTIKAWVSWSTTSDRPGNPATGLTFELAQNGKRPLPMVPADPKNTIFGDDTKFLAELKSRLSSPPSTTEDVLETGEVQPRLPGDVGAVRDREVEQQPIAALPTQELTLTGEEPEAEQGAGMLERPTVRYNEQGRPLRPDGRLEPLAGDKVYQMVPGFGGTPAYIYGEVYRGRNGAMRVRITGSAAFVGGGTGEGKSYRLDGSWTVSNDPEVKRREQEKVDAETSRQQQFKDDQRTHEDRIARDIAAALEAGGSRVTDDTSVGTRVRMHHVDEPAWGTVVEHSEFGPIIETDEDAWGTGRTGFGPTSTVDPNAPPRPPKPEGHDELIAANEKLSEASRRFSAIRDDYQAKRVGDDEYVAGRKAFEAAQAEFDRAERVYRDLQEGRHEFNTYNLQQTFGLNAEQAEASVALADAMGLDADRIRLARGEAPKKDEDTLYQTEPVNAKQQARWYYSNILKALAHFQPKGTRDQLLAHLKKFKGAMDEAEAIGLNDWLKDREKVTRAEVSTFVESRQIVVQDVVRGGVTDAQFERFNAALNTIRGNGYDIGEEPGGPGEPSTLSLFRERELVGLTDDEIRALPQEIRDAWLDVLWYEREKTVGDTKYGQHALPGGTNYREILLTLPRTDDLAVRQAIGRRMEALRLAAAPGEDYMRSVEWERLQEEMRGVEGDSKPYQSPHWDEPNVLAHIRLNDREVDGQRVLFVEEIQSDWHQLGRKLGYAESNSREFAELRAEENRIREELRTLRGDQQLPLMQRLAEISKRLTRLRLDMTNAPPDAPFKGHGWKQLAMKRVLAYAAERGYDGIAWTTGAIQNERYDLRKHVDVVRWTDWRAAGEDRGILTAYKDGQEVIKKEIGRDEVDKYVGKEVAERLLALPKDPASGVRDLSGEDLKVGGVGMIGFYDRELPNIANDLGKPYGVRAGTANLTSRRAPYEVWYEFQGDDHMVASFDTEAAAWAEIERRGPSHTLRMNASPNHRVVSVESLAVHHLLLPQAMREAIRDKGLPLFDGTKAAVEFVEGGTAVIRALKNPDISSAAHELAHIARRHLFDRNLPVDQRLGITDEDIRTAEEWASAKDGKWDKPAEEKFARGFERYLQTGMAPSAKLKSLFEKFREWLSAIYTRLTGSSIDVEISPAMRKTFDRLVTRGERPAAESTEQAVFDARADRVLKPKQKSVRKATQQEQKDTYERAASESKPEPKREFASTQINLPPDAAHAVRRLAAMVQPSDLAENGREDEPHVTVQYGLHADDAAPVQRALASAGPLVLSLGKVDFFPNSESGNGDVLYVSLAPESKKALLPLREAVRGSGEVTDTHQGYKPHATIAYVKPGSGKFYAKRFNEKYPIAGRSFEATSVVFSPKEGETTRIPLDRGTGDPQTRADADPVATAERDSFKRDLEAADITPDVLFQEDQRSPRLAVAHNLAAENLVFADKMGGLAVPSLGVVPEGMSFSGMGEITLIGKSHLGDPAREPIFDADIYSETFPRPEYGRVPSAEAQKILDEFKPFAAKFDDSHAQYQLWDQMVNDPKPHELVHKLLTNSHAAKAQFLKTKLDVEVEPVMRDKHVEFPWAMDPEFRAVRSRVLDEIRDVSSIDPRHDEGEREITVAARSAIRKYVNTNADAKKLLRIYRKREQTPADAMKRVLEHYGTKWGVPGDWVTNESEVIPWSINSRIEDSIQRFGQREVDDAETRKRLEAALAGHESEFKQWVEDRVIPRYGSPFLRLDRRKVSYTLPNIVDFMTRGRSIKAREKSLTFGEGKARAAAARRFTDLETMRNYAAWNIADEETLNAKREVAKKALSDWRDQAVRYYGNPVERGSSEFGRVWEALDASMRALSRWALGGKTPENLRRALYREGFRNVPRDVLEDGVGAGRLFLEAPVPYYEAKPQRAVRLDEFAGAVIPKTAPVTVREILDRHGIAYREYDPTGDKTGFERQKSAAVEFRRELAGQGIDVLFQEEEPTTTAPARFITQTQLQQLADWTGTTLDEQLERAHRAGYSIGGTEGVPSKAGNINLDKFPLPAEAKAELAWIIEQSGEYIEQRRGVRSWDVTRAAAEAIGAPTRVPVAGQAFNAEELESLGGHLNATRERVEALGVKLRENTADIRERAEWARLLAQEQVLLATYAGANAEAGRALNILRKVRQSIQSDNTRLMETVIKMLGGTDRLKEIAERLAMFPADDLVGKYRFVRSLQNPGANDWLGWWWYTSLLSGPLTHARNLIGNTSNLAYAFLSMPATAAVDSVRSAVTQTPRTAHMGEAHMAFVGLMQGRIEGWKKATFLLENGFTMDDVTNIEVRPPEVAAGTKAEKWLNVIGRGLEAADTLFRSMRAMSYLHQLAYTETKKAGYEPGSDEGHAFASQFIAMPPAWAVEAVAREAKRVVFRAEPGRILRGIMKLRNDITVTLPSGRTVRMFNPMRFFVPFVQTPANIMKVSLEASPIGLITGPLNKESSRERTEAVGRAVTGTMMLVPLAALVAQGMVSGSGPDDRELRDQLYRTGWQPNSIRIGDRWYNYSNFQPIALPLSILANAYEAWVYAGKVPDLMTVALKTSRSVLQQSYLQGMWTLMGAIENPERRAGAMVDRTLNSLLGLAGLRGQIARAIDPTIRQPDSFGETVAAGTPGLSTSLRSRRDAFGEEAVRGGNILSRLFSPVTISEVKDTPLERELFRLRNHDAQIGFPGRTISIARQTHELTADEYDELLRESGRRIRDRLEQLITEPGWTGRPDSAKGEVISMLVSRIRGAVREQLILPKAIRRLRAEGRLPSATPAPALAGSR